MSNYIVKPVRGRDAGEAGMSDVTPRLTSRQAELVSLVVQQAADSVESAADEADLRAALTRINRAIAKAGTAQ